MNTPREQPMMKTLRRQGASRGLVPLLLAFSVMANGFLLLQISSMKDRIQEQGDTIALMKKTNEQLKQTQERKSAAVPVKPQQAVAPATVAESTQPGSECWIREGDTYKDCLPQSRDY